MEAASFRLSWSRFPSHVLSALDVLRQDEDFVDVSIYCAGRRIKAHRNVLSASSAYFKEIFKANPSSHPVVILCDVDYASLRALVDFMYHGEIEVPTARLDELLRLGEMLQVQGISSTQGTPPQAAAASPTPPPPTDPADPPLPLGDAIAPECVITEPSARGAAVAARKRRRRPPRRDDAADLATPAGCGVTDAHDATAGADHVTPGADHVMPATGHVTPAAGHVTPAAGHVMPATGHVTPAIGHVMPATGHVTPAIGHERDREPAAEAPPPPALPPPPPPPQLTPGGQPSPPAADYVTPAEAVDWSVPEPTGRLTCPVKPEPAPEPERVRFKTERAADAADSKLLLDDMLDNSGQDTSPYSGGMFVSSIALGRPMTGAERARRYRERKKLKKLYETLLGQSPRREQLAVQL